MNSTSNCSGKATPPAGPERNLHPAGAANFYAIVDQHAHQVSLPADVAGELDVSGPAGYVGNNGEFLVIHDDFGDFLTLRLGDDFSQSQLITGSEGGNQREKNDNHTEDD